MIFGQIIDLDNMYKGYITSMKNKKNKFAIYQFTYNLKENMTMLQNTVIYRYYLPDFSHKFVLTDTKPREIVAPSFRDTILQHSIYNVIRPYIEKRFIYSSFGCKKGSGTLHMRKYLEKNVVKYRKGYYLKCDVKKYYDSINQDLLRKKLDRIFKEEDVGELTVLTVAKENTNKGIHIGCALSQILAVLYLTDFDNYVKHVLKIKCYARYMDDFIFITETKEELLAIRDKIKDFIYKEDLELKYMKMNRVDQGIKMIGYLFKPFKTLMLRHTYKKAMRRKDPNKLVGTLGHANGTLSQKPILDHMKRLIDEEMKLYPPEEVEEYYSY